MSTELILICMTLVSTLYAIYATIKWQTYAERAAIMQTIVERNTHIDSIDHLMSREQIAKAETVKLKKHNNAV